jgi:beta-galactosidase/beta-glucuronidase
MKYLLLFLISMPALAMNQEQCAQVRARLASLPDEINASRQQTERFERKAAFAHEEFSRAQKAASSAQGLVSAAEQEITFTETTEESSFPVFEGGPELNELAFFKTRNFSWDEKTRNARKRKLTKELDTLRENLEAAEKYQVRASNHSEAANQQLQASRNFLAGLELEWVQHRGEPSQKALAGCDLGKQLEMERLNLRPKVF